MWPFHDKVDPNKIEIHLHCLNDADVPSFTVKLVSQGQTVLEGSGLMLGADSRLCDIKTETDRFPAPALMAWRLSASRVNSGF